MSNSGDRSRHVEDVSEETIREKLVEIFESTGTHPLIALDLDDVLCKTTNCVANWHNRRFGTDMEINDFYYSTWYKNPGWGTVATTADKVKEFYDTDQLRHADAVLGSLDALNRFRDMGYGLAIVTARSILHELESTVIWLDKHFNGIFRVVIFSSQDGNCLAYGGKCIGTTLGKLQVCETIQSALLIDDSMETALAFGRHANRPVLLFGDYEWNKRVDTDDPWTFNEKLALESGREWWKEDIIRLHSEDSIWRVRNWNDVLQWLNGEVRS
ncbi:hypothetical protein B0F90DRAFT_1623372 [Multifurca ochricompacta]|uniref:Uncharacterized protein n=1 Tax=Multifurca ochricompacta TaxID=376703 RepID=A0AAD4MC56_9AGAM|nr:hypothetical protein B0F90DRAFT_1623372 [Multifurca ochricompacta]